MSIKVRLNGLYKTVKTLWVKSQRHFIEGERDEVVKNMDLALEAERDLLKQFDEIDKELIGKLEESKNKWEKVYTIVWEKDWTHNPENLSDNLNMAYTKKDTVKSVIENYLKMMGLSEPEFLQNNGLPMIAVRFNDTGYQFATIFEYRLIP